MLNVLPEQIKKGLRMQKNYKRLVRVIILSFILIIVPTSFLIASYFFIKINMNVDEFQNTTNNQDQSIIDAQNEIEIYNKKLAEAKEIQNQHIYPITLITYFTKLIPEQVTITSLQISLAQKTIDISGIAANREQLVALQDELNTNDVFTDFQYPISGFSTKENIEFNYQGQINLQSEILLNNNGN